MDTTKPSRLLLLPRELITMILEGLQHDHRALLSISLTCQSIYAMALPVLNRRIVVHNNNRESYQAAVCQLPRMVQYVRELTIHLHIKAQPSRFGPAGTCDAYRPIDILATQGYYPLFTDFISAIDAMDQLQKLTIKGCGYIGPCRVSPAPALYFQDLQRNFQAFNNLFLRAVQGDALPRLRTLKLDLSNQGNWHCEMEGFLYHPRLKELSIVGASIPAFKLIHPRLRISPLEGLSFLCCDLSPGTMGSLLAIPKALRRLAFRGSPRSEMPEHLEADTQLYVNAIKQQAGSLEDLDFSPATFPVETRAPIDLRSLTALRGLRIRPRTLYGDVDMSPGAGLLGPPLPGTDLPRPALPDNLWCLRLWGWDVPYAFTVHITILNNLEWSAMTVPLPGLRYVAIEDDKFVFGGPAADSDNPITFIWDEPQRPWRFPVDCWCCADGL